MSKYLISILLIFITTGVGSSDGYVDKFTGNVPMELIRAMNAKGCGPIRDFYYRNGQVNPPYVYGVEKKEEYRSVAFWCSKKISENRYQYNLYLMRKKNNSFDFNEDICGLPISFEANWYEHRRESNTLPGGLSLGNMGINLNTLYYHPSYEKKGPNKMSENNVIVSSYDGEYVYYYCENNKWLFKAVD